MDGSCSKDSSKERPKPKDEKKSIPPSGGGGSKKATKPGDRPREPSGPGVCRRFR